MGKCILLNKIPGMAKVMVSGQAWFYANNPKMKPYENNMKAKSDHNNVEHLPVVLSLV